MESTVQKMLALLPAKDCGQCGFKTCAGFAEYLSAHPEEIKRCVYLSPAAEAQLQRPDAFVFREKDIDWKDMLGREYDFLLEQFPNDPGPREVILPFNPTNVERLAIKKGDILIGRPAAVACPVTHVGQVMEKPDVFNGLITWCVVGPMRAREHGIEIGNYTPVVYEGIVRHSRVKLEIGRRYHFMPATCMLQSRHSGVVSALAKCAEGMHAHLEGIWIS